MIRIFSPSEKQKLPKGSLLKTALEKKGIFTILTEVLSEMVTFVPITKVKLIILERVKNMQ